MPMNASSLTDAPLIEVLDTTEARAVGLYKSIRLDCTVLSLPVQSLVQSLLW